MLFHSPGKNSLSWYSDYPVMKQNKAQEVKHAEKIIRNPEFYWHTATPAGKRGSLRRAQWIIDTLQLKPGMRVLETGCGTGFYTEIFVKTGVELYAVDLAQNLLDKAIEHCAGLGVHFKLCDVEDMPYEDDFFDAVIGIRVLHHFDMPSAFKEINRVLKPGGSIGFCEPNMLNPILMIQKNIPWVKKMVGDTPDETAFFKWSLQRFLISYGYEKINIQPFDFLYPRIPGKMVAGIEKFGIFLETIPIIRHIAGSLRIVATIRK